MPLIQICNLHAAVNGKQVLKGVDLSIGRGKVHAIMGPNGAGKSTLAKVLMGDPSFEVTEGEVWFKGQNLLEMAPEERARSGLFMSFQYPAEIAGVSNRSFLALALAAHRKAKQLPPLSEEEFDSFLTQHMQAMGMKPEFIERGINEGFSGGEKKRNEILQMSLFDPDLAILDETDSGLDIDSMKIVAAGVNRLKRVDNGLLVITHYQRLLDYISPDFVHVFTDGRIVQTGDASLALELEAKGYS